MVVCPNCQTENRSGAKFCRSCAARLPETSPATRPLDDETVSETITLRLPDSASSASSPAHPPRRTDTKPLALAPGLIRRPVGAIFGDAFLYKSLTFSDETQSHYLVTQLAAPEQDLSQRVLFCPNPNCGAFFPPRQDVPEKFCTDCGAVLELYSQDLLIIETLQPASETLLQIAHKGLSHGSVRAPLMAFEEYLAGQVHYCLVMPPYGLLEAHPESRQVLVWGEQLARGLEYLHANGIWFGGRIDRACFGLVERRVVWANLASADLYPEGAVSDRLPDLRALANQIFYWMTGKTQYERTAALLPAVNQVFERALGSPGFSSGSEFASALEHLLQETAAPQAVDYRLGRRTHVGMVRNLNEDSIFTAEVNRIQQSTSQPVGVYVVADGMGGHAAGEMASGAIVNAIAQKSLSDLLPMQEAQNQGVDCSHWLRQAVEAANKAVYDLRRVTGTDMGSTLVAAVLDGDKAHIAHVGDSRIYFLNSQGIRQLTTDHSLVERLIATNQITREEARHHPQRNVVYRTVGDKAKVEVEMSVLTLQPGDFLLLCSDGLSGMVDDLQMHKIVMDAVSPQTACDALIAAANAAGGEDNISVVIVGIVRA